MVWDTSREDETLVATSGISDDTHREPVYKLQWVAATDSKKYNVSHLYNCSGYCFVYVPKFKIQTCFGGYYMKGLWGKYDTCHFFNVAKPG